VLELRGDRLSPLPAPERSKADRVTDLIVFDDRVVVASAGAGAWVLDDSDTPLPGVAELVWSLAVHEGSLYAGTFVGVQRLDPTGAITLNDHDARALASVDGGLLIGSRGQGLARLGSAIASPLPVTHVQGLDDGECVASDAGLWVKHGRRWVAHLDDGLPSGDVTALLELGDRLIVATFDRGLAVCESGRCERLDDPSQAIDPQVNALAEATDGRFWVASARGLHRVGPDGIQTWTEKHGLPHASVLSLAVTRAGELVVGTHAGVAIVDERGDVRPLGSRARSWSTWAIAEAPDGELFLGTTQGVIRWKPDGTWEHLSMLSGTLSDNWITALLVDGDTLYVGSYAGGVDRLARDGTSFVSEPLGGGRINPGGLSKVDGVLHAATMKGVLERRGRKWVSSERAALFEDATAVLQTRAGVWVASRRGLLRWPHAAAQR
jgi:ligand-binding sensor domain-containing protein